MASFWGESVTARPQVAPPSVNEVGITTTYLANSTTWTASARELDATATNWGLNVVVICATVAP